MNKKRDRGALLFISILLHGLLVLLPWQEPQSKESRPVPTPTGPISIVNADQVPTLQESKPQPDLSTPPPPAAPPQPPVAEPSEPTSQPETSDNSTNEPAPSAAPNTVPATTSSSDPAAPTSVTPAEEQAKVVAAEWENLVGYLKDRDEGFVGFSLFDIFDSFGTPIQINQFNQFFKDANGDSEIYVFDYSHFPTQTPEQVLQTVVKPELESNTGFDLHPQETFSAGRAYQLSQGEMLRYLIIVSLRDGEGSVLILSESLPGLES